MPDDYIDDLFYPVVYLYFMCFYELLGSMERTGNSG